MRKKVFISYSWDSKEHQEWVLKLASDLIEKFGVDIILDQFELIAGKDLTYFMETSIETAEKILIILTPNYKLKAESRKGGVGYETSMITQELFESQITNVKFIPVLKEGDSKSSSPKFLRSKLYHEMISPDEYDMQLTKLAKTIYGHPLIEKPQLGPIPDFLIDNTYLANVEPIIHEDVHETNQVNQLDGDDALAKEVQIEYGVSAKADGSFELRIAPTVFFSSRIAKAFPGVRGIKWYHGEKAMKRLSLLLKNPIRFDSAEGHGLYTDPIWWFRGRSAMYLDQFSDLGDNKCLLDYQEFIIDKIAVFQSDSYFQSMVYVEALPDEPSGIYHYSEDDKRYAIDSRGYISEEFGLYGQTPISREEYEDGAAEIDGDIVNVEGAKVRIRYLSRYNFIIVAKSSPYNSPEGNTLGEKYMNPILRGERSFEEFVGEAKFLPKNRMDY